MALAREPKKTATQVLVAARELLSEKRRWTQGAYAIGPGGRRTDLSDPKACAWCAAGAIYKQGGNLDGAGAAAVLAEAIREQWPDESIAGFNDDHDTTHEQVLSMFDRAIELSRAAGS